MKGTVLYDGDCAFCNWSVQFIIRRDAQAYFVFAALQSDVGQALLRQYNIDLNINSIVLIENSQHNTESTAALKIARHLRGIYPVLSLLLAIPRFVRDPVYCFIAKNRHRWFGQIDMCEIPSNEERSRFL